MVIVIGNGLLLFIYFKKQLINKVPYFIIKSTISEKNSLLFDKHYYYAQSILLRFQLTAQEDANQDSIFTSSNKNSHLRYLNRF